MQWYTFSFTADEVAKGKHYPMNDLFSDFFFKTGGPGTLVLLSPKKHRGNNFPYFIHVPPSHKVIADLFAALYGAVPCDKPKLSDLALEVGLADFAKRLS